jgi:hypothetical protein
MRIQPMPSQPMKTRRTTAYYGIAGFLFFMESQHNFSFFLGGRASAGFTGNNDLQRWRIHILS